jgi:hypothetical protein
MARTKPLGFDNWRTFSFVSSDGSGLSFFRRASFGVTNGGFHQLFVGPSIISVTSHTTEPTIETNEPHGYAIGQSVRIHGVPNNPTGGSSSALIGPQVVTGIVSPTKFKVAANTSGEPARPIMVTGPNFVVGETYVIASTGGTSFTSIGASANTVGVTFVATDIGTGITGTAYRAAEIPIGTVGVSVEASIDSSKYSMIPGDLVINDHPTAWEMPLVG